VRRTTQPGLEDTLAFLRAGGSNLHPIERTNLGDLRAWCTTAIHLQCASGCDTLSLWNEGVTRVIGIDISDLHIANAEAPEPGPQGTSNLVLVLEYRALLMRW
jgi:hypothetical protein